VDDNVQASLQIIDELPVFNEKNDQVPAWNLENILTLGTLVYTGMNVYQYIQLIESSRYRSENCLLQLRYADCQLQCDDHGGNDGEELWWGV